MNVYSKIPLYLLSAGLTFAAAAPVLAACVSNDCSALGYTKSESACSGDIIRCPFDTSKVFCKEGCNVANCKECEEGSSTSCKTCEDGYSMVFGFNGNPNLCVKLQPIEPTPCNVPNCKVCELGSSTSCNTCEDGYMELVDLINGGPTTCVKQLNPIKPPSGSTCNGVSLTCGNNKYCCPTNTGITSCSQINSGQTYKCYIENINNAGMCSLDEKPVTCNGVSYCCSGSMSANSYCNNPTLNCRRNY